MTEPASSSVRLRGNALDGTYATACNQSAGISNLKCRSSAKENVFKYRRGLDLKDNRVNCIAKPSGGTYSQLQHCECKTYDYAAEEKDRT